MATLYREALDERGRVLDKRDDAAVDRTVEAIPSAKRVVVAGGREGLQTRSFAIRMPRLGKNVSALKVKSMRGVSSATMRSNSTNLE